MRSIDLNCDLGEGAGQDGELMPLITSANIACGGHAGDAISMRATVLLAQRHGVVIGAHPGYADRSHFGRREIELTSRALAELLHAQISALREIAPVRHVKPHGALYNVAARDRRVADVIAAAVRAIEPTAILIALAGSELVRAGVAHGLRVAQEVFADRTYRRDGSLTPRSEPGALIAGEDAMVAQVMQMVTHGTVRAVDGVDVRIAADTLCVHGDGPNAVSFATRIGRELHAAGIAIHPVGQLTPER